MTNKIYARSRYEIDLSIGTEEFRIAKEFTEKDKLKEYNLTKVPLPKEDGFLFTADKADFPTTSLIKITGTELLENKTQVDIILIGTSEAAFDLQIIEEELTDDIICKKIRM